MDYKKGISIIICCYNSQTRIETTLRYISSQRGIYEIKSEIILVNNASTDDTKKIATEAWTNFGIRNIDFLIIEQPIPGLSNARMKGVQEANYEYIIFCDDDNWLEKNYLQNAYNIINSDKKIGALGGRSIAVTDDQFPDWWNQFKDGYAVGEQAEKSGDITKRKFLWGAGMITPRELYLKAFPKEFPSLLTDRYGEILSSGGDSEYCMRLILMGYKLYYDDSLIFTHYIAKERLTEWYREKLFAGFTASQKVLIEYLYQINYSLLSKYKKMKSAFFSFLLILLCYLKIRKRNSIQIHINNFYRGTGIALGKVDNLPKSIVRLYRNFNKPNSFFSWNRIFK